MDELVPLKSVLPRVHARFPGLGLEPDEAGVGGDPHAAVPPLRHRPDRDLSEPFGRAVCRESAVAQGQQPVLGGSHPIGMTEAGRGGMKMPTSLLGAP